MKTKQNLAFQILNFITTCAGTVLFVIMFVLSILCALRALLSLAEEYRVFFRRFARSIGVLIIIFGLLLPFRNISSFPLLLSLWWGSFLFEYVPRFQFVQGMSLIFLSWGYWIYFLTKYGKDLFFMLKIGDFMVFTVIPTTLALVMLSRGTNVLEGKRSGPTFPLSTILNKAELFLKTLIPPGRTN